MHSPFPAFGLETVFSIDGRQSWGNLRVREHIFRHTHGSRPFTPPLFLMDILAPEILKKIREAASGSPFPELRRLWLDHPAAQQAWLPACLEVAAQRTLADDGDTQSAYDLAAAGESHAQAGGYPTHEFQRLRALALARSGATAEALRRMESLVTGPESHALSHGLLARTYRDLARDTADPLQRSTLFLKAADCSERGWRQSSPGHDLKTVTNHAYLANQVAQFAFLGGDIDRSRVFQQEVISAWERVSSTWFPLDEEDDFWWKTNLAEMDLLKGDLDSAADNYRRMRERGAGRMADVVANARVCRLLLEGLGRDIHELDPIFALPVIAVFSGHMFDLPERPVPRFPEKFASWLKGRLVQSIDALGVSEGFVSASAGADLLFAEALLAKNCKLHLILPFDRRQTLSNCFPGKPELWAARFQAVLEKAHRVKELETTRIPLDPVVSQATAPQATQDDSSLHFAYANQVMLGLARLRSTASGLRLQPILVWDEADRADPTPGGTGDFGALCARLGLEPTILPPCPKPAA